MLNQFSNLSCYEEFEIQSALAGISKINILKEIGHKIDNYYFFVSDDGLFNWYDLEGNHIEDPDVLKELNEQHIPNNIIKCIIPNSVTSIGERAFYDCELLEEIIIPNSVKYIGWAAFDDCRSLKKIIIPNSIIDIGHYTFFKCVNLKEIIIPNSIIDIGNYVFCYCVSLKSITIPDSVITIGRCIFENCSSLKEVIFKGRTLDEVKQMGNYPFGIEDESIIKCV
jgi:hypothetical protein